MRTKLNAMRAIPGLVAVMMAAACGSTATSEPGAPPGGEPQGSPAAKPGTASSRIVQVGSTITKGCKGTAIFDLIGAEPIDAVKIEATGTRDLATELYMVDAHGKETKLSKRARTVASTEDAATRKETADEDPMVSGRLAIAPGEPNPSAPDDTDGDKSEPDGDGDDDTASAEAALTASDSGSGAGADSATKIATAVAKSVADLASKGLAMPGSATSGGAASGLGSVQPGSSGLFPGQAELIAAIEKQAAEGRTASQQAFEDIHQQALDHADSVKQRIADAQAGKGLGPIDLPGSDQPSGGEKPGGPSGEPPAGSGGEPGGQPHAGSGGEPTTGGGATAGGEPQTGGSQTGGSHTGEPGTTGTGGDRGGLSQGGVERGPVAYRGQKGVKQSPTQQARMYDGLKGMSSKHFRLHVTFQAMKAKPTLRLVESAADKDVLAEKSFSSAFPTTCK